jgi:cholesterol oxidase
LLDRLLSTVPYATPGEFQLENPFWPPGVRTPWVGVRHRMDALYGVTFKLKNLSREVLAHIDDFFGPMSFQTVSQVIHFAEHMVIADKGGECCFVDREKIKRCFIFPVLHIHGKENGLVAFETFARLEDAFVDLGKRFQHKPYCDKGHQDCMIGFKAEDVFRDINSFLEGGTVGIKPTGWDGRPLG